MRGCRARYFRERGWENLVGGDKREGQSLSLDVQEEMALMAEETAHQKP